MTVGELIKQLESCDRGLRVVVNGYEGGLVDLTPAKVFEADASINYRHSGYMGPHELAEHTTGDEDVVNERVLILSRSEP